MKPMSLEQVVRNIDRRLEQVEQILPTLPTRDEMHAALNAAIRNAVAPLGTREESERKLDERIAPLMTREEFEKKTATLATKDELRDGFERARTYTQIHYEDLKGDIRLLADGVVKVQMTLDRMVAPRLEDHERRITALDDARGQTGGGRPHGSVGR